MQFDKKNALAVVWEIKATIIDELGICKEYKHESQLFDETMQHAREMDRTINTTYKFPNKINQIQSYDNNATQNSEGRSKEDPRTH